MAQNSNHFASNSISLRILSHLNFFELKKVSHFGKKTRDPSFEEKIKEKWMVRILSHLDFKCITCHVSMNSFDDFLSHLTIPPVLIMHVTSSNWTSMRDFKILSHPTISNWFKKHQFWSLFWLLYVDMQRLYAFVFADLYVKVRKLTEGQKFSHPTIWRVLVESFVFWTLITQRGVPGSL